VDGDFFGDATGELPRIGEDDLLELVHVLEGAAIGASSRAGRR
jgi:hypothetical protein